MEKLADEKTLEQLKKGIEAAFDEPDPRWVEALNNGAKKEAEE